MKTNVLLVILLAFSSVIGATSTAATSSFSREGRLLTNFRYLPISFHQLLYSKIIIAWGIPALALSIFALILIAFVPLPFGLWFGWVLLSYMILFITTLIGIALDTDKPKLEWSSEEEIFHHRFVNLILLMFTAISIAPILLLLWKTPYMDQLEVVLPSAFIVLTLYLTIGLRLLKKRAHVSFEAMR
ncbi:hypothetical protein U0355_11380 [Salimicrobium sp. PL1-032A]|uniref:hypothetical protein n=1 Tax=Salimicrobium sp. PL1-032A TaxID=3095364 RepID=UPI003260D5A8